MLASVAVQYLCQPLYAVLLCLLHVLWTSGHRIMHRLTLPYTAYDPYDTSWVQGYAIVSLPHSTMLYVYKHVYLTIIL